MDLRTLKIRNVTNKIHTDDDEHLEMPKHCSEKTKADRGERFHQMFIGLSDWLVGGRGDVLCHPDPFSLKTYQLGWLKSNMKCKKVFSSEGQ